MAIVRTLSNGNKVTDWSQEVMEIDNMFGLINAMGLFRGQGTSQESVIFEKEYRTATLIPQTSRRGKPHTKGRDRKSDVFSLALPYFSTSDYITPSDIQGHRKVGTPDSAQDLASAIAAKMEDMKANADQTIEYMKLQALKGVTVDPEGNVIADMFNEFGLTKADYEVTWDITGATPTDSLPEKIRELRRAIGKNAKTGTAVGNIWVLCSPSFFEKIVQNVDVNQAFLYQQANNGNSDPLRQNLQMMREWGVQETFTFQGMTFVTYDCQFTLPDGTVVDGIEADKAHVMVEGVRDLYRAWYGPANTLSGANQVGQEMFMYQWTDPKDKFHEMELEMSPLYVCMKPQLAIEITAA